MSSNSLTHNLLIGARLKTLPAAVVPVLVGTAAASTVGPLIWWRAVAAMVVSLGLQVATNYVNDYADGDRGTDDDRVGPVRLVGSGLVSSRVVKIAAGTAFVVAGLAGLMLAAVVGWELLMVGAVSMLAGWAYTGGPAPYGYYGLGEVFVFVFFGVVATVGSAYVHTESVTWLAVLVSVPVGFLAVALLVINNLRDIPTDRASGKQTLAVKLGDRSTRFLYVALFAGAAVTCGVTAINHPFVGVAMIGLLLAIQPAKVVLSGAVGEQLIGVLGATGRVQIVVGLALALGVSL